MGGWELRSGRKKGWEGRRGEEGKGKGGKKKKEGERGGGEEGRKKREEGRKREGKKGRVEGLSSYPQQLPPLFIPTLDSLLLYTHTLVSLLISHRYLFLPLVSLLFYRKLFLPLSLLPPVAPTLLYLPPTLLLSPSLDKF